MADEWKIPSTPEEMERAGERFRAATAALKAIESWLDRKGENPPGCVVERAKILEMTPETYYQHYQAGVRRNWLDNTEEQAMEDWAIHQVQPNWKRNPNPNYPKHWNNLND